jgi:tripartite-type tricarboxylate transporter receptor subunit TctC
MAHHSHHLNHATCFRALSTAVAALALLATAGIAHAQERTGDARAFYAQKTVKFIVGYGPGGGYDIYARMLQPSLAKELGATVIVENQPGAGSLTALNQLYASEPNGLQIMIVNGTAAGSAQLIDQSAVRYDLAKMGHLGLISAQPWIWLAAPNAPYNNLAEALAHKTRIRWAATGLIDSMSDGASIMCEALKLDCQIIMGYKGSSDAALSVFRGETDSIYISDTSGNNYIKAGQAKPIVTMSREKSRFFPTLPTIFESMKLTSEQEEWFALRATLDALGRILVTAPNVPADRLAFLQESVKNILNDPALIAEGERTQRYIEYQSAEATRQMAVDAISSLSPERKKRVSDVMTRRN